MSKKELQKKLAEVEEENSLYFRELTRVNHVSYSRRHQLGEYRRAVEEARIVLRCLVDKNMIKNDEDGRHWRKEASKAIDTIGEVVEADCKCP